MFNRKFGDHSGGITEFALWWIRCRAMPVVLQCPFSVFRRPFSDDAFVRVI